MITPIYSPAISRMLWQHEASLAASLYLGRRVVVGDIPHANMCKTFCLSESITKALIERFDQEEYQPFDGTKFDPRYKVTTTPYELKFYDFNRQRFISEPSLKLLLQAFDEVRPMIEQTLSYRVNIVNCRFFEVMPGYSYEWHTDNFPVGLYKLLVYLTGASNELGTTHLRIHGQETCANLPPGGVLLFDSNNLVHRIGEPSAETYARTGRGRISIEYTIAAAPVPDREIPQPGLPATYPKYPFGSEMLVGRWLGAAKDPAPPQVAAASA